jgi:rfaE bifunctional protein kinase chain/domain
MLRIDREVPGEPGALAGKLLQALKSAVARADALMVSDYGGGLLAPAVVEAVRAFAKSGKLVCVDARYGLAKYRGVTVAKPNEVELEQAVGRPIGDDPRALEDAGRELLRALDVESLLVTRGRSGMALLRPGAPTALVPVHGSADAVDVTGAGDTVMAVNTLARAAGAEPIEAMRLANVGGALVVQKPGTATLSLDELRRELRRSPPAEATLLDRPLRSVKRAKR